MSIVAIMSKYPDESLKIGEYTASRLGYQLVTMENLIKTTAEKHDVAEKKLIQVTRDLTLWHQLFRKKKMKLISLLEHQLCNLMAADEMVFCGYVGYPIIKEISHALKVLVLAKSEPGKPETTESEQEPAPLSNEGIIKWFEKIYNANMEDPNLYDLTINLSHMDIAEAGDVIINTLRQKRFEPMTYSLNCMCNMELACQVKTALIEKLGDVEVKTHDKTVYVYSKSFKKGGRKAAKEVKEDIMRMPGVDYVEVYRERAPFDEIHI
jgi:hypothetical protein